MIRLRSIRRKLMSVVLLTTLVALDPIYLACEVAEIPADPASVVAIIV